MSFMHEVSMHTQMPSPREDEDDPDVKQPPVPPDQAPDVVPQGDPPKPGEHAPMIAAMFASPLLIDAKATTTNHAWKL